MVKERGVLAPGAREDAACIDNVPPPFPPSAVKLATSRVTFVFRLTVEKSIPDAIVQVGASITRDEEVALAISYKKVPVVADLVKKLAHEPVVPPPVEGTVIVWLELLIVGGLGKDGMEGGMPPTG